MGSSVFHSKSLVLIFISVSIYLSSVFATELQLDQSRESKSNKELLQLLGNRHGRRALAMEEEQVVKKKKVEKIVETPKSDLQQKKNVEKIVETPKSDLQQKKKQIKPTNSSSSSSSSSSLPKIQQKKNVTSSNSSDPIEKPKKRITKISDLPRSNNPKNKTTESKVGILEKKKSPIPSIPEKKKVQAAANPKPKSPPISDFEEPDDLIEEFRDLPNKFQETIMPDLEHISKTSRAYLYRANQEITDGFKPLIGNRYAPFVASVTSYIFLILPLLLVSLLFTQIKSYFSLTKILLFIQIYLAIYFAILCLAFLLTGVEPLWFFYDSSMSSYVYMQVLQTLGYVIYLLLQLLHLVVLFSGHGGIGDRVYGLMGSVVSSVVGLHYYSAVFHRALLQKPPRTNWKVHGVYSVFFVIVCLCARRGKKAYLEGGDDGKKS